MACMICGDDLGNDEAFLSLYQFQVLIINDSDDPVRRPVATGDGFHLKCFKAVLLGGGQSDEGAAEAPPLESYPEAGYCAYPGCINRAHATPEGSQCAAGHITDPLDTPYREGDQD